MELLKKCRHGIQVDDKCLEKEFEVKVFIWTIFLHIYTLRSICRTHLTRSVSVEVSSSSLKCYPQLRRFSVLRIRVESRDSFSQTFPSQQPRLQFRLQPPQQTRLQPSPLCAHSPPRMAQATSPGLSASARSLPRRPPCSAST